MRMIRRRQGAVAKFMEYWLGGCGGYGGFSGAPNNHARTYSPDSLYAR